MYISKIRIYGFGRLKNLEMDFSKDINIIYGPNESGKSTILAFIKACLYGLSSRGNLSERTKYAPWDNPQSFGGEIFLSMRIENTDTYALLANQSVIMSIHYTTKPQVKRLQFQVACLWENTFSIFPKALLIPLFSHPSCNQKSMHPGTKMVR